MSNEVFLNLANWATLAAVGSILLAIREEPLTRADAVVDISLLLVCSLSTPYSICLWVLFLARWVFRRTSHSAWLLIIAFAASVVQVSNMAGRISTPAVGSLTERADEVLYRFGFIFLGEQVYQLAFSGALGLLGLIGCAGLYGAIAWRAVKDRNRTAMLILIGGGVVAAVSLFVTRSWAPVDVKFHAGRHQYIPSVTLIWALACLERSRLRWVPIGMAFAAFVWLTPANKREVLPDLRWAESVSGCLEQPDPCLVPINPAGVPQTWYVTIVRKP